VQLRELGRSGLQVSPLAFGGNVFGWTVDEALSFRLLDAWLDAGFNFVDTADVYSAWVPGNTGGESETIIGRWLAARPGAREKTVIATKVSQHPEFPGLGAANVRAAAEASLGRLGVDTIDLYYLHRPPEDVEIEETVAAMGELVEAGKVRHLGLSEVDDALLRRAHAVHPITAVQSEYSLWTRDPETTVLSALRELNVALVPFSPLGRGFLTGAVDTSQLGADDFRANMPRFTGDNLTANQAIVDAAVAVARRHGVTAGQVALAWVIGQADRLGVPVVPIPGTKRVAYLEENAAALDLELTDDDYAELDPLGQQVVGARY
jgi:aryl-alcohol dehydrogenase-like predicted oxidoreductase